MVGKIIWVWPQSRYTAPSRRVPEAPVPSQNWQAVQAVTPPKQPDAWPLSVPNQPQRVQGGQLEDYLVMERGEFIARDLGKYMIANNMPRLVAI